MYDSVQLVQNSAALNGTQRVLLDDVISEEECSDLKHLAHVRSLPASPQASPLLMQYQVEIRDA